MGTRRGCSESPNDELIMGTRASKTTRWFLRDRLICQPDPTLSATARHFSTRARSIQMSSTTSARSPASSSHFNHHIRSTLRAQVAVESSPPLIHGLRRTLKSRLQSRHACKQALLRRVAVRIARTPKAGWPRRCHLWPCRRHLAQPAHASWLRETATPCPLSSCLSMDPSFNPPPAVSSDGSSTSQPLPAPGLGQAPPPISHRRVLPLM